MVLTETHRHAGETTLLEGTRNPVMPAEQWFRAAEIHALLAIESRLGEIVERDRLGRNAPR